MNQPFEPPHPNGAPPTPPRRPRRRIWFWLGVTGAVLFLGFWAFAIWFSLTAGSPEDLDDASLAALGAACDEAFAALEDAPQFPEDGTADDNLARIEVEDAIFNEMLVAVDAIQPDSVDAARALDAWVNDWRALLEARAEFAADLADDGTARLRVPAVSAGSVRPISDRMNEYALARGLGQCGTDTLQAENVDGVRQYARPIEEN